MGCNCENNNKLAAFSRGVVDCESDGKPGYRADYDPNWHKDSKGKGGGKCFTYEKGNEQSRKSAKYKAFKQLYAIEKSLGVYSSKTAEFEENVDLMDFMRWMNENFPHESTEIQMFARREASLRTPGTPAGRLHVESIQSKSSPRRKKTAAEVVDLTFPGMGKIGTITLHRDTVLGNGVRQLQFSVSAINVMYKDDLSYRGMTSIASSGSETVDQIPDGATWCPKEVTWPTQAGRKKKAEMMDNLFGENLMSDFIDYSALSGDEILEIHRQQMADTAQQIDEDSHKTRDKTPSTEWVAASRGFRKTRAASPMVARVIAEKHLRGRTLVTATVVLAGPGTKPARGKIVALGNREFTVLWSDKTVSVEEKKNYSIG
jgi:hypothetical protein